MRTPYMKETEEALLHTYNRFPVEFDRGEGVYLYDAEGRKYLDFAAGIAVCGLGYGHPELTKALKEQAEKLLHTSNLFYNESCGTSPAGRRRQRLKRPAEWTGYFLPTAGRKPMKGCSKRPENMHGKEEPVDTSLSQWKVLFTGGAWERCL